MNKKIITQLQEKHNTRLSAHKTDTSRQSDPVEGRLHNFNNLMLHRELNEQKLFTSPFLTLFIGEKVFLFFFVRIWYSWESETIIPVQQLCSTLVTFLHDRLVSSSVNLSPGFKNEFYPLLRGFRSFVNSSWISRGFRVDTKKC